MASVSGEEQDLEAGGGSEGFEDRDEERSDELSLDDSDGDGDRPENTQDGDGLAEKSADSVPSGEEVADDARLFAKQSISDRADKGGVRGDDKSRDLEAGEDSAEKKEAVAADNVCVSILLGIGMCIFYFFWAIFALLGHIFVRVFVFVIPAALLIALGAAALAAGFVVGVFVSLFHTDGKYYDSDPCNLIENGGSIFRHGFTILVAVFSSFNSWSPLKVEVPDYCACTPSDETEEDRRRSHFNHNARDINKKIDRGEAVNETYYNNTKKGLSKLR
jgi:hypothetical protein